MKRIAGVMLIGLSVCFAWRYFTTPVPTVLSIRIGQAFDEVAKDSSYPVLASSDSPHSDRHGIGVTWVTKPAVIIKFTDPRYGFTLPPTTFGAVMYVDKKVSTVRTSASLKKLTFADAASVLENLQGQLQHGGWQLDDQTTWFDFSRQGKKALHDDVRSIKTGYMKFLSLVAPEKYSVYLTIYCAADCDSAIGLDRYLVDVGIGEDFSFNIKQLVTFPPHPL